MKDFPNIDRSHLMDIPGLQAMQKFLQAMQKVYSDQSQVPARGACMLDKSQVCC